MARAWLWQRKISSNFNTLKTNNLEPQAEPTFHPLRVDEMCITRLAENAQNPTKIGDLSGIFAFDSKSAFLPQQTAL